MMCFLPIFIIVMKIATSRSEKINFGDLESVNRDWRNFISNSDEFNDNLNDRTRFQRLLQHRQRIEQTNIPDNLFDIGDKSYSLEDLSENDLDTIAAYLIKLLEQPSWESPLVILDEREKPFSSDIEDFEFRQPFNLEMRDNLMKRSRYYIRHPHKRQHIRFNRFRDPYEYDTTYSCSPSRDDIFQLLGAIHQLRQGDKDRNVHFCNRPRTTRTLLTHIRFLGRRK